MKKRDIIHIAFTLLTLFNTGWAFAQSKTYTQWKADMDSHRSGGFSFERHQNKADHIIGPLMSVDISDKYWEAFGNVNPHIYAWMASGDAQYLDYVLDVVQRDIENAVNMSTANPEPQSSNYSGWDFNAFLAKPNYFSLGQTVNISTYINNANPLTTGYGRRTDPNGNNTSPGVYIALDEGMYNRNIANLARVMHNNISSIGTQISNNGQTYQQRLNVLVTHLRDHVWARNFENPNVDSNHYARDVYRVNTHMSSHLAMVALCLYVIEGDQKYRDFVEEYLWDFSGVRDANPGAGTIARLPAGVGLLDKLEYQSASDSYWWVSKWEKNVGDMVLQDEGHAVAELQILKACYEEGIGLNPPDGEPVINLQFMQRMSNSIQNGYLKGYECADGQNEPSPAYRLDGTGFAYGIQSALAAYAEFNPNILCYLEARVSGIDLVKTGQLGVAMYTSRLLGVGGDAGPAYTTTGSGVAPENFRPQVVPNDGTSIFYEIGDLVTESGATWTDVEDGTGQVLVPTRGSVPVDGSNFATTFGTYVLEYDYTDTGSLTGTGIKTVYVGNSSSTPPSLVLSYQDTTVIQYSSYTPPTYTWTDDTDGTGTTGAVIVDSNIDTDVVGTYSGTVSFTNSNGLTDVDTFTVRVDPFSVIPVESVVLNSSKPFYMSNNSLNFPNYTIYPTNATNQGLDITVADPSIADVEPTSSFSYQFLAKSPGETTFTLTSQDNPSASVTGTLIVRAPKSVITIIINN